MDDLYKSKSIFILSNEHTFFVGDKEIRYLFSQYGYSSFVYSNFKGHSLFYRFDYDKYTTPLVLSSSIERSIDIKLTLLRFEENMKTIVINTPIFICPSGGYGQKVYYYLEKYKEYILGFIDNDPLKQGKRLYGTTVYVYSPYVLQEHKDKNISIILYGGVYTHELKSQLNQIHSKITYIEI
jgi:hypothetical protein